MRRFIGKLLSPKVLRLSIKLVTGISAMAATGSALPNRPARVVQTTDVWVAARREIEATRPDTALPAVVQDAVEAELSHGDMPGAIRLSYLLVPATELPSLDRYWVEFISARQDGEGFGQFLRIRDNVVSTTTAEEAEYLRDWMLLAKKDDYSLSSA